MGFIILFFVLFAILFLVFLGVLTEVPGINIMSKTFYRKKEIQIDERNESLKEGGSKESHPFRDLSDVERKQIFTMYKNAEWFRNKFWFLIPLFLFIDVLFVYGFITGLISLSDKIDSFFFLIIIEVLLILYGLSYWKKYLDLRSPVFRVQGKAIKEKVSGERDVSYYLTIRNIRFSEKNYDELRTFFDSINDEEEVVVEYSPRTKHIWKIYKDKE